MPIKDEDVAALAVLLAPERLAVLNALTGSTRTAIELHQETVRLGASLMNVIASIEIALRNAICENLSKHFVAGGWLLNPPAPFQWREVERKKIALALDSARRSEYAKLSQADKHALDLLAFPNGRPPNLSTWTERRRGERTFRLRTARWSLNLRSTSGNVYAVHTTSTLSGSQRLGRYFRIRR